MNKQIQSGFTIYELMITLVVVSIVLVIGIPNLVEFTKNSRMASSANDLLSAFVVARSEAPRAKTNITICASSDPLATTATCDGNDDWTSGWIVFVDADGDISVDNPADEPILRRYPAMEDGYVLDVADNAEFFSYGPNGLGRNDVDSDMVSSIIICDDRGNVIGAGGSSTARRLVVSPMGRAAIIRDVDRIAAAGGCP